MAEIVYGLETLSEKHGGLLEFVEAIVADGKLILIHTDQYQRTYYGTLVPKPLNGSWLRCLGKRPSMLLGSCTT